MNNYTRLSMRDRCNLATFLDMGLNISEIAARLGRHRSTLYRELSRNHTDGHYRLEIQRIIDPGWRRFTPWPRPYNGSTYGVKIIFTYA